MEFRKGINAQANITTGTYNQNFGTASLAAWTNNVTILGWYIANGNATPWGGELNITAAAPTNTGRNYAYTCSGGTNRKIGSRASGGTGTCYFGVLLRNTTGFNIQSFYVNFTAFQMSRGGNTNANPNTLAFEYIISTAPIAVNAAGATAVPALDYAQTQFTTTANTGGQTEGFPCTVFLDKAACITANLPNNDYILFRWVDIDDVANDPHFAIDDLSVAFDLTGGTCTNFLPIELLDLSANYFDTKVVLNWTTLTETSNSFFTIERSKDGISFETIGKIKGAGSTLKKQNYSFTDNDPHLDDVSYYRLKQTDQNGNYAYSKLVSVDRSLEPDLSVYPNPSQDGVFFIITDYFSNNSNFYEVLDYSGRKMLEQKIQSNKSVLDLSGNGKGLYILRSSINGKTSSKKIVFN